MESMRQAKFDGIRKYRKILTIIRGKIIQMDIFSKLRFPFLECLHWTAQFRLMWEKKIVFSDFFFNFHKKSTSQKITLKKKSTEKLMFYAKVLVLRKMGNADWNPQCEYCRN